MFALHTDPSFQEKGVPFGVLEVLYPDSAQWDLAGFDALKERELIRLKADFADYDRKAVFGENPYNRYFKKYKKTYPVLQQLESVLLKGRPFPSGNPINEIAFLTELRTQVLMGAHDIDTIQGIPELFCPEEKLPFIGMRGEEVHTYPGDCSGRDDGGIIWGLISGADFRTHLHPETNHVAYLFFGVPGAAEAVISDTMALAQSYIQVLAPTAEIHSILLP